CRHAARATTPRLFLRDRDRLHAVALPDGVDVLHPARHLPEDGVVVVEVRLAAIGDVELATRRVGVLAAGHRERSAHVLVPVWLRGNGVAGTACAVAFGAPTLHDEPGHDAVEGEPVVEAFLGERDEVLHRLGRVLLKELEADLVAVVERDDASLFHFSTTLIGVIRSPTRILSTTSMPLVTWPNAVYLPFRNGAGPSMMYTWLPAESGSSPRAMPSTPRSNLRLLNSALTV